MMSPMLNNPESFFKTLEDTSHEVNFYEAFIVSVLLCRRMEYEDRLQLVFHSFDLDGSGLLNRRELH